ncbi:GNAT family N-acetyltransferase [Pseudomonas sp. EA_5y_Pfl2_R50]|uniref:GNAT family N-acetyltransferase n=1 Tax=Pseudomonas sp. EA_5y_Pfl2_R50 TaxID=3088691 RepID=UPI0030D827BD
MEAPIYIYAATPADAGIISRIIERSIRVGCALDHRNDPHLVNTWVRQHSADRINGWLADPHHYLNIALLQDKPVGVAMALTHGEVSFCHVQPEWFRRGAGRALMADLEGWLRIRRTADARLNSTVGSKAFYRHLGYRESAPALMRQGLRTIPMHKPLTLAG